MRKYYSGEILFCGVLRRYVLSQLLEVNGHFVVCY